MRKYADRRACTALLASLCVRICSKCMQLTHGWKHSSSKHTAVSPVVMEATPHYSLQLLTLRLPASGPNQATQPLGVAVKWASGARFLSHNSALGLRCRGLQTSRVMAWKETCPYSQEAHKRCQTGHWQGRQAPRRPGSVTSRRRARKFYVRMFWCQARPVCGASVGTSQRPSAASGHGSLGTLTNRRRKDDRILRDFPRLLPLGRAKGDPPRFAED